MATVQWRPQLNALTTPQSYRLLYLPREVVGYDELAAEIAMENPNYNEALVKSVMIAMNEKIQRHLINGNRVTLENAFSYTLSLTGRLAAPDDTPPPADDMVQVRISASQTFVNAVRQDVQMEKMQMTEKAPLIMITEDTVLQLNNVLNPKGVLKVTGGNLFFDEKKKTGQCVIEGTRSGKTVQDRFAKISNSAVFIVPDIPTQTNPWNNEYILSISARYTANGTMRTGTYARRLRSPLLVASMEGGASMAVGILTDKAASPYVTITSAAATADERLRIQAVLDLHDGSLSFSLIELKEKGRTGTAVKITGNGPVTLSGFAGSALSSMELTVNSYAQLVAMIRGYYSGRLVDILDVKAAS